MAILLGAATIFARMKEQLPGTIKLIFQPAEEGPPAGEQGGAEMMVREGVLKSPDVEAIAAYSWEPEYLWTNAVVVQPVMGMGNGTLSLGVDGVYEEQMTATGRSAYSIGPAVRWSNDRNLGVTLAGGYRKAEERESTWYLRLGAAFYR